MNECCKCIAYYEPRKCSIRKKLKQNLFKEHIKVRSCFKKFKLRSERGRNFWIIRTERRWQSTFINILAGTTIKTSGNVNVWGFNLDKNPRQVRASIGIVPQEVNVDPFFSPRKLLELQAGLYGIKKKDRITDTILKLVSLENQANSYTRSLSGGMKRRLLVAKALVHQPPIIILDEPTAGVDVELRSNLWKNVKSLNKQGVTIILTTHYLLEAEEMCDRIGILNKGNLVALDSTKNLLKRIQTKIVTFVVNGKVNIENQSLKSLNVIDNQPGQLIVSYEKSLLNIGELINYINKQNIKISDISTDDGNLEDVFVRLTKN